MSVANPLLRCLTLLVLCAATVPASAEDWSRFLGDKGDATSASSTVPTEWDSETNLKWRTPLPGPGASSPIVVGDRIFLTCYTGYGDGSKGKIGDLTRHLLCVSRTSGQIQWTKSIKNQPNTDEDPYKSYITQHGYATNTPISDGKSVFVYFGKPGLFAFDLDGNQLWQRAIESKTNKTRWGSAASPIFYKENLILNAVEENGRIYSIDKKDGSINWDFNTESTLVYSTPNLLKTADGQMELIVPAPKKVFGIDPDTGKQKWYVTTTLLNEMNGAVIVEDDIAYMYGGFRGVGSVAVRGGGSGDVTNSHTLWTSKDTSYIATPVLKDKHIYWLDKSGIAYCVEAETGKQLQKRRTPGVRGGRGIKFFASMVLSGDHIYALSRRSGTFILKATPDFPLVGQNKFADDDSEFNGSPAISNNQLFMRSNKFLYCIGAD